jgi:2-methylisocitrate lyase-like PEP mutase family enzyme
VAPITTHLRNLIDHPEILILPGVFDALSLRLVERRGFDGGFVSGAGLSESLIGQPDVGLMSIEENLFVCRRLASVSSIPLIADADTGYGNAINVFHTVRAFERAGVAGVMIEDQTWPKRCGHMTGKAVVPAEEMVEKVRAAIDARRDQDFVIMARTDAAGVNGLGDAIRRLNLYREAGADLLFADALSSVDEIREVAGSVAGPVCVNMGFGIRSRSTTPLVPARVLHGVGVAVVIYPRLLTSSAVRGMENGLAGLREQIANGAVADRPDLAVSFDELNDLVGYGEFEELENRYVVRGGS